jgi:hypothetical protein
MSVTVKFDNEGQVHAIWLLLKRVLDVKAQEPAGLEGLEDVIYAKRACEKALRALGWLPQTDGSMINTAAGRRQ